MRKFLDTFPNVSIQQIINVHKEYDYAFFQLESLSKKIKKGVSVEVEEQYEMLIDTIDAFLFRTENIEKFNQVYLNPIKQIDISLIPKQGVSLPIDEREQIESELEIEIQELMKDVDKNIVEEFVDTDIIKKSKILGEEVVSRNREDFDEEDRFVGITWKYDTFNQTTFEKSLAMMSMGCKFYYATYGSKHFVMFKLKGMGRVIIQTSEERYNFDNIFLPNSQNLNVYMLNDSGASLENIFNIFKDAWDMDEDSYSKLDDAFLFNTPYIYSAYQDNILWKEAELLQQSKGIVERSKMIEKYFSLYTPLEGICTMQMCKENHTTVNVDNSAKKKIEKNIATQKFYIEGIGNVKHSDDILEKLQKDNLLDINYKLTPLAQGVLSYNYDIKLMLPKFRPFSYYMNNLEEEIKKSKTKYYSNFNGHTLYHTKKEVDKIEFALHIPSTKKQLWGVVGAEQVDSFPLKWQQEEDFKNYQQYLPLGSDGNLSIRKMHQAREQRESTIDKIMFRDLDRKNLYLSGTINPGFTYAINAQNYKYICSMYGEDNIRILGPNESSYSAPELVYFQIVDERNNLLAVLSALSTKTEEVTVDESGKRTNNNPQEELKFLKSWETASAARTPLPVWDVDELIEKIEITSPKIILEGKMIGDKEDVFVDNTEEPIADTESKEDVIIDFDNPEEPIIIVEDERTVQVRELNIELLGLQEYLSEIGSDEEVEEEVKEIKEKLEALKQ
jgi:hypothetical protein